MEATVGIMLGSLEGGGALSPNCGCGRECGLQWEFVGLSFTLVSSAKKREGLRVSLPGRQLLLPSSRCRPSHPVGGRRRGAETSDTGDGGRFVNLSPCSCVLLTAVGWCFETSVTPTKGRKGPAGRLGPPRLSPKRWHYAHAPGPGLNLDAHSHHSERPHSLPGRQQRHASVPRSGA